MSRPKFTSNDYNGWLEDIIIEKKLSSIDNTYEKNTEQITIQGIPASINGYNIKYVPEGQRENAVLILTVFDDSYANVLQTQKYIIIWNDIRYEIIGFNYGSGEGVQVYTLKEEDK